MVGLDLLPNAVSLNSVLMNSARVIGPAIGGVLILTFGVATCFFINAASYAAVIVALSMMRAAELIRRPGVARAKGQVREGLRYVWGTPDLKIPLLSMAVVGVFAFNFTVTLPLLAKFTFHGGAGLYSWFLAAMGAGAVVGGLATAFRSPAVHTSAGGHRAGLRRRDPGGGAVADARAGPSSCSSRWGRRASLSWPPTTPPCNCGPIPAMRGRVMSLNAIAFLGSTPIGAPLLGYLSDATNPRLALAIGGVATLVASIPLFVLGARQRRSGTEGLVMGLSGAAPTNVVPLPVAGPGFEGRERRSS